MSVIDFVAFSKCKEKIKELEKTIERLEPRNAELNSRLDRLYYAYQTLQYSCEGRVNIYSSEIESLRQRVESLQTELRKRGWQETTLKVSTA